MKYFIDAGANDSCSARIFRKLHDPNATYLIYSFEVEPSFSKNFNNISNLIFINKAVWVRDEKLKFYRCKSTRRAGGTLLKEKTSMYTDKANPIYVEAFDFSKWVMTTFNKSDEIILKMDIEGAEYDVLEKMFVDGSFAYIDELWIEWHASKVKISQERHESLVSKINIPIKKWAGIEQANKILGKNYLGKK